MPDNQVVMELLLVLRCDEHTREFIRNYCENFLHSLVTAGGYTVQFEVDISGPPYGPTCDTSGELGRAPAARQIDLRTGSDHVGGEGGAMGAARRGHRLAPSIYGLRISTWRAMYVQLGIQ
jgi:hypothetical protein